MKVPSDLVKPACLADGVASRYGYWRYALAAAAVHRLYAGEPNGQIQNRVLLYVETLTRAGDVINLASLRCVERALQ